MSSLRLLCIDYGEKRIGLAVSDPLQIIARPYDVLENSGTEVFQKINLIIKKEKIGRIVLGLPVNLVGNDTVKTAEVRRFAKQLQDSVSIPIAFWDERYTTDEANKILKRMGISARDGRKIIDKIAASIILKDYIENVSN